MQTKEALMKLREFEKELNNTPMGTNKFHQISAANDAFMFAHIFPRDFFFIALHLGHQITDEETAELIAASYNGTDITEVLNLSPDDKTLLKFKIARRKSGLTQQQVANKTANFSQSQIAKVESGKLRITMTRWAELFNVLGEAPLIQLKLVK
ncbi:helix-turn-helix domain-containing protein [Secundilactobacillus folii]|uniref:Helix-turn-helix domain-containing protein n=1 Tax=Secundilactobacillus folii TaxID=2678357 RepID=A0A7X3C3A8_9LACO|nr:helix-turn-helix transcriptional regulator [Secundilactobacillus folii]MTV82692.1 helix-turn-helix domain-containing protein [Secundilactobacillus folii]